MKGSLRQRSPGSWELTVDMGRDALGKRLRKSLTVQGTKAHAKRKLREILSTLDKGIAISTDRILLRDWLHHWLQETVAPSRRQRTKERYEDMYQHKLRKLEPSCPFLSSLQRVIIDKLA